MLQEKTMVMKILGFERGVKEMEYEYQEYRKDSQADLKEKEVSGQENLSNYEPKEETRKKGKEPKEKMLLENTYGTVNFGISNSDKEKKQEETKKERLVTISKKREKEEETLNSEKILKENGAERLKAYNRRGFVNPHEKESSAMGLKVLHWHTGEQIVAQLEKLSEKENLDAVDKVVPFLAEKEEKEKIKLLWEKRRRDSGLDVETEKYLEMLQMNQIHRKQKKKELAESLNQIVRNKEKQEGKEEKKRKKSAEFLREMLAVIETEALESEDDDKTEK